MMGWMPRFFAAAVVLAVSLHAQRLKDFTTPTPMPAGSTLVVGFLGGFERWNDEDRSVRRVVLRLRERPGVFAESAGNHRRGAALKFIRRALDTDGDGELNRAECASARVVLFGQSLGGAAAVKTARALEKLGVPVLLTAQVDSVGTGDEVIPANVRAAVNFFQHDLLSIQGEDEIRAADPQRTRILGNFQTSYYFRSFDRTRASWLRRTMGRSHVKMEQDEGLWRLIEQYIVDAIR